MVGLSSAIGMIASQEIETGAEMAHALLLPNDVLRLQATQLTLAGPEIIKERDAIEDIVKSIFAYYCSH